MALSMSQQTISQAFGLQFQTASATVGPSTSNSPIRSGETIHSGQFMVSDFEAEAQDEDDTEIRMPDPDDPNFEVGKETNTVTDDGATLKICTAVERYVPQPGTASGGSRMIVSSKVEIETTLAKLFKCMNLAYSQKLTSPKWNHFKGVRLRWKDKIRLNNVIWRCWHMQFFLKRKTPVCQFASPLDVDIHSNPQSVVLEGKYWKRQLEVIQAEYRKWRRNFKSNATGALTCDSKSEFDFTEWPMLNERILLMSTEDWATETLFSAIKINEPFPFPDPREIARDAGRAEFIQPSLGSLQPNLDEFDISSIQALLNSHLEPVPEEGTEDILKSIDYFPMMGSEQMDSTSIDELANNSQTTAMHDANMMEISNMGSIRYAGSMEIDQQQQSSSNQLINSCNYRNQMIDSTSSKLQNSLNEFPSSTTGVGGSGSLSKADEMHMGANQYGYNGKVLKGRITKNNSRFRRREPHNYDKAQPTAHQTLMYQQMLAEQQQQQQQHQQQQASQIIGPMQYSQQFSNASVISTPNFPTQQINPPGSHEMKSYSFPQQSQPFSSLLNPNLNNTTTEIMSLLSQGSSNLVPQQQTSPNSTYRYYNNGSSNFKKSSSTAGYMTVPVQANHRQPSPPRNQFISNKLQQPPQPIQQQTPQQQQQQLPKEMYRSNSLPLNTSFPKFQQKDETFAVPKYHAKTSRSRTRSNSMQQPAGLTSSSLQAATSEPMLNSTLAQLLTSNNNNKLSTKQSISTSAITSLPPSGFSSSTFSNSSNMQPIVQTSQLTQQHSVIQQQHQQHGSPTRSISLPQPAMQSSADKIFNFSGSSLTPTASFSPESYADPGSPVSPTRASSSSQLRFPRDNQRRAGHIHAEQKRRCNIKNGFDTLHSLIPQLQQNPNAKLSKAATLQKAAEYIKQLRGERNTIKDKKESLQKERDGLNNSLTHLHSVLPANGAPVSRQRTERVKQLYNQYVHYKTEQNWKFWILGLILEPLISSYTTTVSVASIEELYRTALLWVDQHCSLVELRPAVSNKLRYLSTTTDILSDPPSSLKDEVLKAINHSSGEHPNLTSS